MWRPSSHGRGSHPSFRKIPLLSDVIKSCASGISYLLGSSGSMLLFVFRPRNQMQEIGWRVSNASRNVIDFNPCARLLVCNPLIGEWRMLPAPANAVSSSWDYNGAQLHLVEVEFAKIYTVVLVFRDRVLVYISTSIQVLDVFRVRGVSSMGLSSH